MTNSSVCGWLSQGALALALLAVAEPLTAQIIPDRTLPSNSRVNLPGCVNCVIEGGTLRGVNLFHSFQEFSIPTGGSAYFNNPSRVENILTRVTGTSLSHIDGLLKANGTANFFLLNPNGILLGANARLELGGSFFVSAADRFQFSDGSEFSATHPQAPPLLTVNLTPGLQVGQRTAAVQNRANLTVAPGQSLTLLGQTTTSSGHLSAAGGRVELLGDRVALLDHAQIDVSGPTGGGVVLIGGDYRGQGTVPTAQQTFVSPLAQINADASLSGDGGKVIVWAEQTTRFFGSISARGGRTGGNGGLVEVSGKDTLNFQGSVDTSAPLGQQGILLLDPANITITNAASPIPPVNTLDGIWSAVEDPGDQTISPAAIATLLSFNNLTLEASNAIVLADSLFLNSTNDLTLRAGQIRNYTLDATGFATFLNTSIVQTGGGDLILETTAPLGDGFVAFVGGGLFNRGTTANGQGGNIRIRTNTLLVLAPEGGFTGISADTFGVANAGDVVINADSTILSGNVIVSSNVEAGAIGQGGIVSIQGGNLSVVNGANVQALLRGQENGFSGAVGIPGQVNVDVTGDVRVSGVNPAGFNSRLASDIGVGAVSISGLGGEINVTAGREIRVEDGALLTTITFANAGIGGRGSAGNINLTANDVIVAEAGVSSVIAADATGDAGNINITAGQLLSVTNGTIASNNASNGRAGNVNVQAPETQPPGSALAVVLDGSEITSSSNGANSGNSGTIAITANTVQLVNNARLRTSAVNPNAASGDIRIEAVGEGVPPVDGSTFVATPQILVRNSEIDSRSNNDSDPDFRFSTVSLRAPNGSILLDQATLNSQNTGASRFAGDIILNARDQIGISQSSIQSDGFFGRIFLGSDLSSILSPQFILVDASQITATNDTIGGTNRSGNIRVSAISQVTLRNNSQLSIETVGDGIGGELTIDTGTLNVLSGTRVSASTAGAGAAGLIEITATEQIEISGIGSAIVANTRDTVQQATGQTVTEIGNAGQTLATAQNATGIGGGFITSIIGAIADANDVDLYQIFLGGGQTFSASTVGGASFDTQLFLFDAEGRGVYANDDASGTLQSILPAGSAFTPTNPGIYFLGVSSYNNDPQSIGGAIFSGGASEIAVPTGPGGEDPLIGWNSASTGSFGAYTITLTGTGGGQQTIIPGGRGGNITLTTDRLNVRTGASISSSTFGSGQGGAVDIQANQLTLDNTGSTNEPTGIFARTEGAGDAGRLTLQPRDAQSLSVTFQNGAEISTTTSGTGAGGFFSISAPESINLSGAGTLSADTSGAGIGGVLSIATGTLSIADGSRVSATATATATADAIGGDLIVSANTLSVSGATSGLFAETLGAANAGNLSLQPRDATSGLTVRFADGARISAATAGSGAGGGLFIQAIEQTVTLMGQGIVSVDTRGPGTGGDLLIDANRLELVDRAKLSASTSGEGDAGLIRITAPGGIRLDGAGTSILADTTDFVPPLVGQTFVEIGNAGQTLDTAQNATGAAGGFVSTIVGSLIDANDVDLYQIFLGGGQTFSASTVGGASFDTQLFLFDAEGRGVYANDDASSTLQSTLPAGSAFTPTNPGIYYLGISSFNNDPVSANGTIFLGSPTEVTPANGPGANNPLSGWNGFGGSFGDYIISLTGTGGQQSTLRGGLGGRIELNTSTLTLENQALISSSTSGSNDGGAIAINATTSVQASGGSTLRARATGTGNAGSLIITTPQLGLLGSEASVSNAGRGDAGTLAIAASQVVLQNDARLTATTETGSGQGITLTGLNSLQVLNSLISASTVDGVAGGVTVDASGGSVLLSGTLPNGRPGGIEIAATGAGEAGFLSITTSQLTFENGAGVSANNQSSLASSQILLNSLDTFIVRNTRLTASTQDGNAGSFLVNAANSVLVTGTAPDGRPAGIFVESIGTGAAGFLGITTAQLQVAEGAQVSVSNRGVGFGGGLTVNAQNIILNDGQLTAETFAGSGGNITLTGLNPTTPLEILQLSNQSQVSASTAIGGQGGDVSINTRQAVLLTGGSRLAAEATAGGNAGGVAVTTNLFAIDNSQVTVSSRGTGQAGNLEVTAQRVQLGNQSLLAATTEAGSGGNISFSGLNSLLLINSLINASTQSGTAGNVTIRANDSVTLRGNLLTGAGGISVAATEPGGTAGELNIRTGRFVVDNTQVSVSSPFGTAGNLSVLATSIQLERGRLSAFNGAGEGGNILLDLDGRFLFLRNESLIEAEAGGNANGGNIRIDVPNGFIIAFPFENSDITANAVAGRGGVIEINTQALFGIEFRPRRTPLSDITANSQTGADGTVQVNTLGIDPSRGLVALPVTLTDPTSQVAQSCSAQRRLNNRFVVTGRGGLPNSPEDSLSGLQTQVELLEPFDAAPSSHRQGAIAPLEHEIGDAETRIVEAQGWVKTPDGAIALVAETNTPSSKRDWQPTGECEGVSD